ncbi:ankyrin repeat-containing domain protein, partial [Dendryphion nanum]
EYLTAIYSVLSPSSKSQSCFALNNSVFCVYIMDIEESDFVLLAIQDLIDYNDGGHLPKSDEIVAAIQTWLGPTKYFSEHSDYRKHLNSHLSGTGSWFESSKEYQEWHDSPDTGALWIKAVAGAGKSVLSAASITRLLEENVPVLFFFFRQIVALSHESKYLIRDFLSQLLPWSPWLQHNLNKFVESNTDIESVSLDELWRYVCDALSFMPKAYCVVDALDEMDQDESFLQRLITLGKQKPASIKVLLTSRPVPRLENILRTHIPQIRLDPDGLQDDIDKYVEFKLRPIGGPPTFYETLKPIICSRACGLFLYARLVTDELIETVKDTEVRPADIPVIVDNIPKNLEDVYSKMLADHSKRSGVSTQQQLTILQWVTHTTRPLRLLEAAAIMQTIGCTATLKEAKTLVRAACGPLLEILEDETISVIHHSFTEYLCQSDRSTTNFPIIDHEETHRKIAGVCVNYLLSGALNDWKKRGIESVKDSEVRWNPYIQEQRRLKKRREFRRYSVTTSTEWKLRYPLLEYASSNWYKHSNQVHLDASLSHTLEKLFSSSILGSWVDFGIHRDYAATFTQMHIAAYIGADNILSILIQKGQSVDEKDRFGRSPISYAASGGSAAVVSILIDAGADINAYDAVGYQPIHYAAMSNHHKAINILVNAGADVLAGTLHDDEFRFHGLELKAGATAVEFATIAGHTESFLEMMHLLEQNEIHKALHLAASKGRAGVVSSILSVPGIDIDHHNTSAGFYQPPTALFEAVSYCDPPTIRLLLIGGASSTFVHTQQRDNSNNVDTAMHALAGKYGSYRRDSCSEDAFMEAFDLLVNAGCDVDQADSSGETPLHYSCWKSLDTIILRLLEKGADASKLTLNGKSVLHLYYSCTSSPEVADALIASGADINAIIPTTKIAVIHELMRGYNTSDEILRFLEYKPDVRVKDELGFTALHLFAQKRFDSAPLLKKLLELGAEVNAKDHLGRTPAHIIDIYSKHGQQYLQMFVENWGVDINATDSSGRTILLNAGRYFQDYGNPHEMKFQSM